MPLVFSYGTLQQEDVQWSTFGRLLDGRRDELCGFEPAMTSARHANVIFNGHDDSRVVGTAFDISDAELAMADAYEDRAKYKRIAVTLASGSEAWVYVDASTAIRDAALADAGAIAGLVAQLGYPTTLDVMQARLSGLLSRAHHTVAVAEAAGAVVGVVSASVEHDIQADTYGRIVALSVDERWRGRGVGRRLVEHAEHWCRAHGAGRMTVTSGNYRPESHKFYLAIGYEATGVRFIKRF